MCVCDGGSKPPPELAGGPVTSAGAGFGRGAFQKKQEHGRGDVAGQLRRQNHSWEFGADLRKGPGQGKT